MSQRGLHESPGRSGDTRIGLKLALDEARSIEQRTCHDEDYAAFSGSRPQEDTD